MAHVPIVRPAVNLGFSEINCCIESIDPGKILWKATYLPYLQTIFFSFKFQIFMTVFFVFIYMEHVEPMGAKISKCYMYFSHSFCPISTKLYDIYVSHGTKKAVIPFL